MTGIPIKQSGEEITLMNMETIGNTVIILIRNIVRHRTNGILCQARG